ncbi:MAG: hypothetical protein ACQXXF_01965 [Thermoplasmatota archaeon]
MKFQNRIYSNRNDLQEDTAKLIIDPSDDISMLTCSILQEKSISHQQIISKYLQEITVTVYF